MQRNVLEKSKDIFSFFLYNTLPNIKQNKIKQKGLGTCRSLHISCFPSFIIIPALYYILIKTFLILPVTKHLGTKNWKPYQILSTQKREFSVFADIMEQIKFGTRELLSLLKICSHLKNSVLPSGPFAFPTSSDKISLTFKAMLPWLSELNCSLSADIV